ncbi:LacI family DNA-binding transcriptional regulator [Pseudooceanicola algae]|uniref:Catabolite control protein A n=1 Tax=Pseudooceanicola algae TaxID=1537215 RepID=A0A418SIY1_9RHOB|nr:LacI family DNA-binding transcriptional regulator [Pseudooceanicola algae]QPM91167.1 Catabolite control protein A [Pseudooceanicola algae]
MSPSQPPPTRPHRVTAADVAKKAGVSRSAVSRAFTEGTYLDKEKRVSILQVAADLGYRPNALAAGLQAQGRSNLVAVVTGDLANHYDGEILAKLIHRLRDLGKWPMVIGGGEMTESDVLGVLGFPLDAMILRGGSVPDQVVEECLKLQIPLIVSGRVLDRPGVDSVCCDNETGAELAVGALVAAGRRRIAYLGGRQDLTSDRERRAGFVAAMAAAGLTPVALFSGDYSFDGGASQARQLLTQHPQIDGLFCANDAMALGAIAIAGQECDRKVPESLSVIGFDDIAMARWPAIALSTIRNDMDETVSQMMRLLSARLADPDSPSRVIRIPPEFIARNTH